MAKKAGRPSGGAAVLGGHGVRSREIALPVLGGSINRLQQKAIRDAVKGVGRGITRGPGARSRAGTRFE